MADKHKTIRLGFARFWEDFDPKDNFFVDVLREDFDVEICKDPEYVIYSSFGGEMPAGEYVRIFYTPENERPDLQGADWAFTFDYDEDLRNPRHTRLPNYVRLGAGSNLIRQRPATEIAAGKSKFCCYIYKHEVPRRQRFFRALSTYRRVDAPGQCMNNMPPIGSHSSPLESRRAAHCYDEKVDYLKPYKFAVAFENSRYPGYTTEKIYHAMLADCIPIYWGNPHLGRDFHLGGILCYEEHAKPLRGRWPRWLFRVPGLGRLLERFWVEPRAFRRLVARVEEIDRDEKLYLRYLSEPWLPGNRLPPPLLREFWRRRMREIFDSPSIHPPRLVPRSVERVQPVLPADD